MTDASPITLETSPRPGYRRSPHVMALLGAVFTLPLLFVGGSVTTYRVGMAVPDWPSTFGINMFLYDFWNAPFGVQVEHTHRLYGAAVGLATIGLMIWFFLFETRGWIKTLGVAALAAVIGQGILGGTRVTQVSTFLAAVHGCTGQAFFGLMVALAVLTGRDWLSDRAPVPDRCRARIMTMAMLILISMQIVMGAWLRHYGPLEALVIHGLVALAVLAVATVLLARIEQGKREIPSLVVPARCLACAAWGQAILGVAALIYLLPFGGVPRPVHFYEAVVRTGHQTNSALLLASGVVLALRAIRHLGAADQSPSRDQRHTTLAGAGSAPANLEVLA